MLLPVSPEFVTLCQSQVMVLAQGFGASLSVVYLTEEMADGLEPRLVPVVAYPEAAMDWDAEQVLSILSRQQAGPPTPRLLAAEFSRDGAVPPDQGAIAPQGRPMLRDAELQVVPEVDEPALASLLKSDSVDWQIVLPLIHDGTVMGLLVTARSDRPWAELERTQVERIARTLALGCVLDRRAHWLDHDLQQQRLLQDQQHDVLDTLLHQLRNPLTAVRTFGKLLLKRFRPEDTNRDLADGIVRESDRLQELLQQMDRTFERRGPELLRGTPQSADPPEAWQAQIEPLDSEGDADRRGAMAQPRLLPGAGYLSGAELQLESYALMDILQPLLRSATAIAQDRQLALTLDLEESLPPVHVDTGALREVLSNVIDNALKYTPSAGQVYIAVRRYGEIHQQTVVVADTGPGIPSQDLEHLFERHYRGVQAATDIPGTGLGLAIARDLMAQMHGEIQVFSPALVSGLVGPFQTALEASTQRGTAVVLWLPEE